MVAFKLGFGSNFFLVLFYLCHPKDPEAKSGVQGADKLTFRRQDTATFQLRTTAKRRMAALP